jgi:hypothetical protein
MTILNKYEETSKLELASGKLQRVVLNNMENLSYLLI